MRLNLVRLAGLAFLAAAFPAEASERTPEAYVNQLDQSTFGAQPQLGGGRSVYIDQLPADARPAPPRKKTAARRSKSPPAARKPTVPDVGSGVSLALSPAKRDSQLPNVGRGVIR